MPPSIGVRYEEAKSELRKTLGPDGYQAEYAAGAALTLAATVEFAMG
jgi:hypothetical protein